MHLYQIRNSEIPIPQPASLNLSMALNRLVIEFDDQQLYIFNPDTQLMTEIQGPRCEILNVQSNFIIGKVSITKFSFALITAYA